MLKRGLRRIKNSARRTFHSSTPDTPSTQATHAAPPSTTTPSTTSPPTAAPPDIPSVNVPPTVVFSNPEPSNTTSHPSPAPGQITQSTQGPNARQISWAGLKTLIGVLDRATSDFGPLKSAIGGLSGCIEIFEEKRKNDEEYQRLRTDLDALFNDLSRHFKQPMPPVMTSSMASLARGIEHEIQLVQQREKTSTTRRYAEATEDAEEALACYRRIQRLLGRLEASMNANVNMWKTLDELETNDRLRGLPNSPAAQYRSAESHSLGRVSCTPDTRIQVLEQLQSWAHDDTSERIYWLNGMAGTGKTTIAYSMCDYLKNTSQLGASFFCSRQLPECRNVNRIIPTISYQLSLFSLPFRHSLSRILEQDKEVYNRPIQEQFEHLLLIPLREVKHTLPSDVIIVIDALDECDDKDGVARVLSVLLSKASELAVRFLVTSRPDAKILDRMRSQEAEGVRSELRLHELDRAVVQQDIKTYLEVELKPAQISDIDLKRLAERSGVLFIYAATVVRYISHDNFTRCTKRLKLVLDASAAEPSSNDSEVDLLYTAILEAAFSDRLLDESDREEMMTILHTVVCAQEPLSVDTIAELVELDASNVVQVALRPLLSVLNVSGAKGLVTTLHESFPDYILNHRRSNTFYCDASRRHAGMAQRCFDLIKLPNPPFNICGLESSYVLDEDVPDIDIRIENAISSGLHYACRYWGEHLVLAYILDSLVSELWEFLSARLLLWMEVLNLKRHLHDGVGMLYRVRDWSQKKATECSDDLRLLIQDVYRFAAVVSSSPVTRSTPHIYVSALPFWPESRSVRRLYVPRLPGLIDATGTAMATRPQAPVSISTTHGGVHCAAYSPDGRHIISGFADGAICIWGADDGHMVGQPLRGHERPVNWVSYSPDGANFVSGAEDGSIYIWDVRTGQVAGRPLKGHTRRVTQLEYSPDGAYIASSSFDGTVRIWDTRTGTSQTLAHLLESRERYVHSVGYSPDGAHVVSGSADAMLRIWNTRTGQLAGQPLRGHSDAILSVAYSPSGGHIVSSSADLTIRIWDARTYQAVGRPLVGHTGGPLSATYSPDGMYIVSGASDNTIRLWNVHTGQMAGQPLEGHTDSICSVSFSPDGTHIVSASFDGTTCLWDTRTSTLMSQPVEGHTRAVVAVACSPDNAHIISSSSDKTVRIWNTHTGELIGHPLELDDPSTTISLSCLPHDMHIASGSFDGPLCIQSVNSGQLVGRIAEGSTTWADSVVYSLDGALIAAGWSLDHTVRIWDVHTGRMTRQPLKGHTSGITSISFSPNAEHIVSGSADRTIRIWDITTGQAIVIQLPTVFVPFLTVAYSPNGAHIVSSYPSFDICLWDAQTGQMLGQPLKGHTNHVTSVVYSSDGAYIVSGSHDHTVRIWDAHTGQAIGRPLVGHADSVYSVACSSDGAYIVSGSKDRTVRVWDTHLVREQARMDEIALILLNDREEVDACDISNDQITPDPPMLGDMREHMLQPWASHDQAGHHPHRFWELDEDGWVVDGSKLLVWVPLDLRPVLLRPCNTVVISRRGVLQLDFSRSKLGEKWGECYVP